MLLGDRRSSAWKRSHTEEPCSDENSYESVFDTIHLYSVGCATCETSRCALQRTEDHQRNRYLQTRTSTSAVPPHPAISGPIIIFLLRCMRDDALRDPTALDNLLPHVEVQRENSLIPRKVVSFRQ
jgi:hypothetical protein